MNGKIVIGIAAIAVALTLAAGIIDIAAGQNLLQQQQAASPSNDTNKLRVIASFFPLYDFSRNVGGDRAEVSVMVPAGIEPHDWEPTPRNILDAENADMIVYNGAGFESWVSGINARFVVDTSRGIQLMEGGEGAQGGSNFDPHIWLDPVLAKKQVEAIRDGFIQTDPVNSDYYSQNAQRYIAELDSLDSFIRSELSSCTLNDFIAFHDSFSYFANRYNLTQHSVHGVSPEGDVLPQRRQEITDLAATLGSNVIYAEELVDPRLANVIAGEIPNGQVLVLSPIEGLEREELEQGLGYIDKMRENVQNLKVGLKCL